MLLRKFASNQPLRGEHEPHERQRLLSPQASTSSPKPTPQSSRRTAATAVSSMSSSSPKGRVSLEDLRSGHSWDYDTLVPPTGRTESGARAQAAGTATQMISPKSSMGGGSPSKIKVNFSPEVGSAEAKGLSSSQRTSRRPPGRWSVPPEWTQAQRPPPKSKPSLLTEAAAAAFRPGGLLFRRDMETAFRNDPASSPIVKTLLESRAAGIEASVFGKNVFGVQSDSAANSLLVEDLERPEGTKSSEEAGVSQMRRYRPQGATTKIEYAINEHKHQVELFNVRKDKNTSSVGPQKPATRGALKTAESRFESSDGRHSTAAGSDRVGTSGSKKVTIISELASERRPRRKDSINVLLLDDELQAEASGSRVASKPVYDLIHNRWTRDMDQETKMTEGEVSEHGNTLHPVLPRFRETASERISDALFAARSRLEFRKALHFLAMETRPGSRREGKTEVADPMPEDFEIEEETKFIAFGYNEHGELGVGHKRTIGAPLKWPEHDLRRHGVPERIQSITLGWSHGVITVKHQWDMATPPEFGLDELKDEEVLPDKFLAKLICDWATPKFKNEIRDDPLPEEPEEMVRKFDRNQLVSMYLAMSEKKQYGSVRSSYGTFTWGYNNGGQLGLDHNQDMAILTPVISFVGLRVHQVACGGSHTLFLLEDGALLGCGENKWGQLGTGETMNISDPQCLYPLTHIKTRTKYAASAPSRTILIGNLEPFITERAMWDLLEEFFGFDYLEFRNADLTQVGEGEKIRPSVIAHFVDEITASHCRKQLHGDVVGNGFYKDPMRVTFFHPRLAGYDILARFRTKEMPCLVPNGVDIVQVVAGFDHSMALLTNGQVLGWGNNTWGQVGTPFPAGLDPEMVLKFEELPGEQARFAELHPTVLPFCSDKNPHLPSKKGQRLKWIAAGGHHSIFLTTDGRLFGCGWNHWGQLGLGPAGGIMQHGVVEILEMQAILKTTNKTIRTVVCGASNSFAIMHDGSVYGFGRNDCRQLGIENRTVQEYEGGPEVLEDNRAVKTPKLIQELGDRHVLQISANEHTMVVCEGNEVLVFGNCSSGQLAIESFAMGNPVQKPTWHKTREQVTTFCAGFHSLICKRAPLADGNHLVRDCVYACGYNKHGELGIGEETASWQGIAPGAKVPQLVSALDARTITIFEVGWYHTICLVDHGTDSEVFGFGYNKHGQLGCGHSQDCPRPVPIVFDDLGLNRKTITKITCGGLSSYFVTSTKETWACGSNSRGQLGVGVFDGRAKAPIRIKALKGKPVSKIVAGFDHVFAMVSKSIYAFGNNQFGQLGLGNNDNMAKPTLVKSVARRVKDIWCGGNHTIITKDMDVLSCGRNDHGQCGIGHKENPNFFCNVHQLCGASPEFQAVHVAGGPTHTAFLLANGFLAVCGNNSLGQLGLKNGGLDVLQPLFAFGPHNNCEKQVVQVSCAEHTVVVLDDATVLSWGDNSNGQLGVGNLRSYSDWQALPMDGKRCSVFAGAFHTLFQYSGDLIDTELSGVEYQPPRQTAASKAPSLMDSLKSQVCSVQ